MKYIVSKETEIILDGQRYLLEPGDCLLLESIEQSWSVPNGLLDRVKQAIPNKDDEFYESIKSGLVRAEQYIDNLGRNSSKIIARYIKKRLSKLSDERIGHINDRIYNELKEIVDKQLPPEQKTEQKIEGILAILKRELKDEPGWGDEQLEDLARTIVSNNQDVYEVIKKILGDKTSDTKKFLAASGPYKLYEITSWGSRKQEKHIDTGKSSPAHIDMEGTSWCTRFRNYFDRYMEEGPLYLINKYGKPFILLHNESDSLMNVKDESVEHFDKNLVKLLAPYYSMLLSRLVKTKVDKDIIRAAIDAGAKPDRSTLKYAVKSGNPEVVKMVIDAGAKLDESTLSDAARSGNPEIVKMIIDVGAKPDESTFSYAVESGNPEVVKMIIDAGVKPDESTLSYAARSGNPEMVKMIIDAGAKPNEFTLSYAARSGNPEVVKMIIDTGAKPNEFTLSYAVESGNPEMVKMIIDAGVKPNESTFSYAARSGNPEMVKMIIDTGAKPDEFTLSYAVESGNPEMVKMIIDAGAKPNSYILDDAVKSGNPEIIRMVKQAMHS